MLSTSWLPVSHGHELRVEQSGCAAGIPVLVLHGGPGSGCSALLARFFDPERYRVICVDQRGAGGSRPAGGTEHNTTSHLLLDLRLLRERLAIDRWLVVGGSWGATLALLHAIDEPRAVSGLLLRNVFLARRQDVDAFFGLDTELGWQAWAAAVPGVSRQAWLVDALNVVFQHGSEQEQHELARFWWRWECERNGLACAASPDAQALRALVQRYRIQSHYLSHHCWLDDRPLLDRCAALPIVPTLMLHGTADAVCPPDGAQALQQRAPHAMLRWIPGAGHDPTHPEMVAAMVDALDRFAARGNLH